MTSRTKHGPDPAVVERLAALRSKAGGTTSSPAAKKAGAPPPPPTTYSDTTEIPEGHKAYSEVFGKPPSGRDYPVRIFEVTDWPEELQCYIPTPDTGYVFPKEQTETLVTGLLRGKRSQLLYGPKGSGKSSLTEQVCARINMPFIRVNMSEDAESSRIFGTVDVQNGSMEWIKGVAEIAATAGGIGCVLQIDEVSATPPGIALSMQWMLERDGKVFIPDRIGKADERLITPSEWFRVVCTDNTALQGDDTGKYAGTNVQNEAFIDRMNAAIHLGYLAESHEAAIIQNKYPLVPKNWVLDMLKVATLIRAAYDEGQIGYTISPRGLLDWADEALFWGDLMRGFKITFFDKLMEDDKRVIGEKYCNVTSEKVS